MAIPDLNQLISTLDSFNARFNHTSFALLGDVYIFSYRFKFMLLFLENLYQNFLKR